MKKLIVMISAIVVMAGSSLVWGQRDNTWRMQWEQQQWDRQAQEEMRSQQEMRENREMNKRQLRETIKTREQVEQLHKETREPGWWW